MLPLLSSFDGMLHEFKSGIKYEGGPNPSGDDSGSIKHGPIGPGPPPRNGNVRPVRNPPGRGPGGDRDSSSQTGQSDPITQETCYETYLSLYKYSEERSTPFKQAPGAAGGRGEADIALVEQHLKVFSLQGLRTMGRCHDTATALSSIRIVFLHGGALQPGDTSRVSAAWVSITPRHRQCCIETQTFLVPRIYQVCPDILH